MTADNNITLNAGNNLNIASGNDYSFRHEETKKTGLSFSFDKGQFNYAKMKGTENTAGTQTNVTTNVSAGGDVSASATRDVTVLGSNVSAGNDVTLTAGNDVHIAAAESSSFNKSSRTEATYGVGIIANENELGIKQAVAMMKDMSKGDNLTHTSSNIAGGNDVNINSGNDTNVLASNVTASNDVNVNAGGDLNIMSIGDEASSSRKHIEAEIGVKASVSQNITTALHSIGEIFTIGNPLEGAGDIVDAVTSGELDGNRKGIEDAAKVFNAYNSAAGGGGVDGGIYAYGQVAGLKSSTHSTTQVNSNVAAGEDITTVSGNDTNIRGANVNARSDLDMTVGGDMNVESRQNISDTSAQQFSANIQVNVLNNKVAGGINAQTTEANRTWTDDQTEITGGNSVNINVTKKLDIIGAKIANIKADGTDGGNLNVSAAELTHSDLIDKDKSVTKGIGVSVGINTDGKSNDNGGISGVSLTYNDSKKEGITRATIGEGTVTVGGVSDDKGINRDITRAQEVLIDEGMEVIVNVPIELIKNPKQYFKDSNKRIRELPSDIKELPSKIQEKIGEVKAWAEAHGLKIGLTGEGENLEVKLYVPEEQENFDIPFDGEEFGVAELNSDGEALLRNELGLQDNEAINLVISESGEAEITTGAGDAGVMTLAGSGLILMEGGAGLGATAVACAASVVCAGAVVVGVVVIGTTSYVVYRNSNSSGGSGSSGGASTAAGGMPDPDWEPDDDGDWKTNPTKSESKVWKEFNNYKKDIKTNGQTGSKQRFYKWDYTHNDIEVYNKGGKHLGSMDPVTGKMYKGPVPGRTLF